MSFTPFLILPSNGSVRGWGDSFDSFTKSMLKFNGLDGATVCGDEMGKIWTAVGNAQLDTAQSKFGVSSLLLDGTGDYITSPDSADWFMSTGDFTIDCWIRINSLAALVTVFSQTTDATNSVVLNISTLGVITFTITATVPVVTMASASSTVTTATWYHLAVVRSGNNWNIYVNGTSVANTTDADAWADYTGTFQIGANNTANGFNGWIDEFRVSKGVARWTTNFTAPTSENGTYTYVLDDSFTKALLHGDCVADGSQAIYDESQKIVQANGGAQLDTAQSVFGGCSIFFDGTGDYLEMADSADWQLDAGSDSNFWTVDFRVRFNGDPGTALVGFLQQRTDNSNFWSISLANNNLNMRVRSAGSDIVNISQTWNPATATWYHIAIVKNGTSGYMHFVDGTQVGSTTIDTSTMPDFTGTLLLGDFVDTAGGHNYLNGWMDEIRVSKGVARWTANFTPPTAAYS